MESEILSFSSKYRNIITNIKIDASTYRTQEKYSSHRAALTAANNKVVVLIGLSIVVLQSNKIVYFLIHE